MVVRSHSNHFSEETYRVHRLVARRARINMQMEKPRLCSIVLAAVERRFPHPDPSKRNLKVCTGFLQRAEAILAHSKDFEELEDVRNQLKSKIELSRFYAYKYKKDKLQGFTSSLQQDRQMLRGMISEHTASKALNRTTMPEGLDYDLTAATLNPARFSSRMTKQTRSPKLDGEVNAQHGDKEESSSRRFWFR